MLKTTVVIGSAPREDDLDNEWNRNGNVRFKRRQSLKTKYMKGTPIHLISGIKRELSTNYLVRQPLHR